MFKGVDAVLQMLMLMPNKFSADNNMDPGHVPPQLQGLTPVEKLLIAKVNPTMTIHRLSRGGQFGFKGHVLNLSQNVNAFLRQLPRTVHQLDVLVLRKENHNAELPPTFFTVNRQRVLSALQWLHENNEFYRDIEINMQNIAALPENGVIQLPDNNIVNEPQQDDEQHEENNPVERANNLLNNEPQQPIPQTFAPQQAPNPRENEAIAAGIQGNHEMLDWPAIGNNPVNEFRTVGYIACAFPCLFPTGAADLHSPRATRVTALQYFAHLLRYHDGRFQADPRFVFFAYNTYLRHQALQVGSIYAVNQPGGNNITAADIRDMLETDRTRLTNSILRFGRKIRGTPQYWYSQTQNILQMVKQIGPASVFFTFSVADHQWPDLHRFLDVENHANIYEAIAHSPLTVDSYVLKRFEIFFNEFFRPYLNIKDHWYRVEWQHRGSLHIHGLAWLENIPDTTVCAENEITRFWNMYVNSWNPAITPQDNPVNFFWPVQRHPCSIPFNEVQDLQADLKDLVNICQRHTRCSPAYCLQVTPDGQQKCRFGFPKPLQQHTSATFTHDEQGNRDKLKIIAATNDPSVNKYNSRCLSAWRANMDINVTFNMTDVCRYIAKYASKGEKATADFTAILTHLVHDQLPIDAGLKRAASSLLVKTVGHNDVCAQQAAHVIASLNLVFHSRDFVTLTVDGGGIQDNVGTNATSDIRKYMLRPQVHEDINLLESVKKYKLNKARNNPVATFVARTTNRNNDEINEAIVTIVPRYSSDPAGADFTKFCMQTLLLRKPFRRWNDVWNGFPNPVAAYHALIANDAPPPHEQFENFQRNVERAAAEIEQEQPLEQEDRPVDDWMQLLNANVVVPNNPQRIDPDFDWQAASQPFLHLLPHAATFLVHAREQIDQNHAPAIPQANPAMLNAEQLDVYNHVVNHVNDNQLHPLRAVVLGTAGTGKSYLIHCIKQLLQESCVVLAPTGVAALNITWLYHA